MATKLIIVISPCHGPQQYRQDAVPNLVSLLCSTHQFNLLQNTGLFVSNCLNTHPWLCCFFKNITNYVSCKPCPSWPLPVSSIHLAALCRHPHTNPLLPPRLASTAPSFCSGATSEGVVPTQLAECKSFSLLQHL